MAESDNKYFDKNMKMLRQGHSGVFEIISDKKEYSGETELVFAENKKPNLKVKTSENEYILIHDQKDPGVEAEVFLSMVNKDSTGVVLMFGMGLGYSVLELLRKRKKLQYMVVFELNVEFFIQAIKNVDLTDFFMDKRVMICIGEPSNLASFMAPANRALMLEDIHTLNLQSCFKANHAYENLSSLVFDYINAFNTEGATRIAHGRTFFENRLKHLTSMHHDKKLEDLTGKFKGIPALIIAAGPSLDRNIDQINQAAGKAIIISVDTALPSLLNHGIIPDFITSIDYNELTYEKIFGSASNPAVRKVNLICTSWVATTVTKQFPADNIFWAFNNNALENWINVSLGGKVAIAGAGTVAHLNFISAQIMGCEPIIFVGQDLAFTNSRGHSSNVVLTSDETAKKMLDNGQDIMWVKGLVESKVPTNRQMYGYKNVFEKLIRGSERKVINSTEGGALIEGAENIPLADAIDRFCKAKVYLEMGERHRQESPLEVMELTIRQVQTLEKIIQKADKLAEPLKKKLGNLKKTVQKISSFSELPEKLRKKISDLELCHKKADESQLWTLFDEMTMEGVRQDERQKQDIEKLMGIPDRYLDWLSKSVSRIDKVNKIRIDHLGRFKKQLIELVSYYRNEKLQLERIQKDESNLENILELAKLYFNSDNYVRLEKILNIYASGKGESAAIHYYQGIVALVQGDYQTAESRFRSAVKYDISYDEIINKKRNEIADYYWKLAVSQSTLRDFGQIIVERLLLKGLKCCPGHLAIMDEFIKLAEDDLKKIKMKPDSNKTLLKKWIDCIARESEVIGCLKKDMIMDFYLFYGKLLVDEKNYHDALEHYQKARSILPDNPDIEIALADIHFAIEDFDSGLQYLKTAVSLDKQYAVYWYNMGKNLELQNDFNGAILAYEQYFIALPENISVLKEIGDCHKKLGNFEAAREALEQFKKIELKEREI